MYKFRFLFFLYTFPPVKGTAAKRNFRIASFITDKTAFSRIFTAASGSNGPMSNKAHIETVSAFDYRTVLQKRTLDGAVPERKKSSVIAQFLVRLINTFPINIMAGEGGLWYLINLIRKGSKRIRQDGITHLYSSYRPFADHYAAYWLKQRFPNVYWVADFRDLVIDPHYKHILFPKRHHTFFKKIFGKADMLTTVSDGLAKHLLAYNANVVTLRNGVPNNLKKPLPSKADHFTIVYSGSMFLDKRNPEPIFLALQELFQETTFEAQDIKIIYAGKDGWLWRKLAKDYRFESIFEDKGIVSDTEARALQQKACVNVLLTISSEELQGVLTGKLIEYVEAGPPVLGIVVHQNDPELQAILQSVEIGDSFADDYKDMESIKTFLVKEYQYWKSSGTNRIAVNFDVLKDTCSMDVVMRPFFEKLMYT
jgi:hypothetical protein